MLFLQLLTLHLNFFKLKKNPIKKLLIVAIIVTVAILSCSKQGGVTNSQEPSPLSPTLSNSSISSMPNSSLTEAEAKNISFNIGEEIVQSASEISFRKNIYKKVSEQFDGDYNVLIKDLQTPSSRSSSSRNLNNIPLLEKEERHLQIYIPFFEELKSANILGTKDPVIIFDPKTKGMEQYPGYKLNKEGKLTKLDFLITEDYAEKNEVWVFSFNERVGHLDEIISVDRNEVNNIAGRSATPMALSSKWPTTYIKSIMTPNLREIESWINGRIELVVRVYNRTSGNFLKFTHPQIRRKYLRRKRWYNVNIRVFEWNPALGTDILVHWVELDGGKETVKRQVTFPAKDGLPGISFEYTTQSDDQDLGYQIIQRNIMLANPNQEYSVGLLKWKMSYNY